MGKKQTAVSHCSTDSDVISSDAGLRINGIPALDLRDLVNGVLHSDSKLMGASKSLGMLILFVCTWDSFYP